MNNQSRGIIKKNRMQACRRLLNGMDITNFDRVPEFIINSFFGQGTYRERLLVTTFGFVNGLSTDQLFLLLRWKPFRKDHQIKIIDLYKGLEDPVHGRRYYSFNVALGLVVFCNGDIRKHGTRIPISY